MPQNLIYCPQCHREVPRKPDVNGRNRCRHCGHVWYLGKGLKTGLYKPGSGPLDIGTGPIEAPTPNSTRRLRRGQPTAAGTERTELPERSKGNTAPSHPLGGTVRPIETTSPDPQDQDLMPTDMGLLDDLAADDDVKSTTDRVVASGKGSDENLIGREMRGCSVEKRIGAGGMGTVYLARQVSLDRPVALKVLSPELRGNRDFIKALGGEAKTMAKISHPNVLHVYDFGEDPVLGIWFMVMEYVDGSDLTEMLRKRRRLPPLEALDLVRQAAMGLEHAAGMGVIHRDLKPDNLMITKDGVCKVTDFGLATVMREGLTDGGVRVGTPAFMSPEQCQGSPVDVRSDIYALGCTAYVAMTGTLPYEADSPYELMLRHRTWPVPKVSDVIRDIPSTVDILVQRMMAKRPGERYNRMQDLVDAIDAVHEGPLPIDNSDSSEDGPKLPDWMEE